MDYVTRGNSVAQANERLTGDTGSTWCSNNVCGTQAFSGALLSSGQSSERLSSRGTDAQQKGQASIGAPGQAPEGIATALAKGRGLAFPGLDRRSVGHVHL